MKVFRTTSIEQSLPADFLVAWGEDDGCLWILFRDATSGTTTYPANRQLLTEPPAADTLPFAVEAGEQTPVQPASVATPA